MGRVGHRLAGAAGRCGAAPAKRGWPAKVCALPVQFCRPAALQWLNPVEKRC
jgi:hypothetical protein